MSEHADATIPRPAIIGASLLVVLTVVAALAARLTGVGTVEVPPSVAVESRQLVFEDAADGSVRISAPDGAEVLRVEPGTNGFLRGVLRGLARERKLQGIGPADPFLLTRWADGRLTLEDPRTGRRLFLGPFGSDNVRVFVRLLGAGDELRTAAATARGTERQRQE